MNERTGTLLDAVDLHGAVIGRVEGVDDRGRPLVSWPGREGAPCPAVVLAHAGAVEWVACRGARALLALAEDAAGAVPVLVGLIEDERAHGAAGVPAPERAAQAATACPPEAGYPPKAGEAPRDVHIEGAREIVLRCGEASIALRSDGRIVIRGGYILSRSSGANKIKGATVRIN